MSNLQDRRSAPLARLAGNQAHDFIVGQNQQGAWIAQETHGLAGGIFVSRDAALHYAEFETDHRPGAVRFASRPLQLRV